MAKKPLPTPDELRQLLDYDPETGVLTWRERPRELFSEDRVWRRWNTRYSGTVAGSVLPVGYRYVQTSAGPMPAHRIIWAMIYDEWPEQTDHINGDRTDNRLANLRSVCRTENQRNLTRRKDNTSGVTGVYRYKSGGFLALIGTPPHQERLGIFDSIEAAAHARKQAEARLGYHANHGRERTV